MSHRAYTFATGALLLVSAGALQAATVNIDDFSSTTGGVNQVVSSGGGTGHFENTQTSLGSTVIGGSRTLGLDITADLTAGGAQTRILPAATPKRWSTSLADDVDGSAYVEYAGLGGVDMLGGALVSQAYFNASVYTTDQNVTLTIAFQDTAAFGGDTATYTTGHLVAGNNVYQLLSSFANSTNVDFQHIDRIRVTMSGPTSLDASISLLEVTTDVPVPGTLALLGLGLAGFGASRRRAAA